MSLHCVSWHADEVILPGPSLDLYVMMVNGISLGNMQHPFAPGPWTAPQMCRPLFLSHVCSCGSGTAACELSSRVSSVFCALRALSAYVSLCEPGKLMASST